jgi:hypothetical protein
MDCAVTIRPLLFPMGGASLEWAVALGLPECESTSLEATWRLRMIGVALAQWLMEDARVPSSEQHLANRLGDAFSSEAEQLEQLTGRSGLAKAIDSNDRPRATDVLVPKTGRPGLDRNAR